MPAYCNHEAWGVPLGHKRSLTGRGIQSGGSQIGVCSRTSAFFFRDNGEPMALVFPPICVHMNRAVPSVRIRGVLHKLCQPCFRQGLVRASPSVHALALLLGEDGSVSGDLVRRSIDRGWYQCRYLGKTAQPSCANCWGRGQERHTPCSVSYPSPCAPLLEWYAAQRAFALHLMACLRPIALDSPRELAALIVVYGL